jgi:DNA replication licensing factor MCM5
MSGFDADRVYSVSVHQNANTSFSTESPSDTEKLLLDFLLQYRIGGEFIYRYPSSLQMFLQLTLRPRDKLRANLLLKHYQLEVDLRHVSLYNDELAHLIQNKPSDILPLCQLGSSDMCPTSADIPVSLKMPLPKPLVPFCFPWKAVPTKA